MRRPLCFRFVLPFACAMVIGCAPPAPGAGGASPTAAPGAATPAPTAAPVHEAKTLAEVFPAGAGRELVLNNCGSCHNVACAAMSPRSAARWDALKAAHTERAPGVDLDLVFGYLKEHFGEGKSLPKVPSVFLEGGCTPF